MCPLEHIFSVWYISVLPSIKSHAEYQQHALLGMFLVFACLTSHSTFARHAKYQKYGLPLTPSYTEYQQHALLRRVLSHMLNTKDTLRGTSLVFQAPAKHAKCDPVSHFSCLVILLPLSTC